MKSLPPHLTNDAIDAVFERNRILMVQRLAALDAEIKAIEDYLTSKMMFLECFFGDLAWKEYAGRWRVVWEQPDGKYKPANEAPISERLLLAGDLSSLIKAAAGVALK
jgi:hypothetical protein